MSKNLIFCADGTWNGPNEAADRPGKVTNVFKLFSNLAGTDTADTLLLQGEQERVLQANGKATQHAKYLHGVGDSENFLVKAIGGGLGAGLIERIVRGYTYISRNYQLDDKIFLVGFSRGAYTVRALGGMIASMGLLNPSMYNLQDRNEAYMRGAAVWLEYRKKALASKPSFINRLKGAFLDQLPGFFITKAIQHTDTLIPVEIEAIAVWDTVGAYGIPVYNLDVEHLDLFQFADLDLSSKVKAGIHAVAIDELRKDFTPTLWNDRSGVRQALFCGAHSDVGGGYDGHECGLSDGALEWMMNELKALGLIFAETPAFKPTPDAAATAHQPWIHPPFKLLPQGWRLFPKTLLVSKYVKHRLAGQPVMGEPGTAPATYKPNNLSAYWAGTTYNAGVIEV